MSRTTTRRTFLKTASLAAAGVAGLPAVSYGRILGSAERVRVAVVGLHGRGSEHINALSRCRNVTVSAVCDVDRRELDRGAEAVTRLFGSTPLREVDVRKLLSRTDLDAITVATPEHWQAPMAILALASGKHVYLEKPGCHNPAEGEMLIAARRKHGGHVQMGNQQRSAPHTIEAMRKIHEGVIGRPYFGKAWYSNRRGSIGRGKKIAPPKELDWDLWQGPAPRRPYRDNVHPYNWHWFRHWGTGETLNNATHEVDLCLWALGLKYPKTVNAQGGRYHFSDDWEFYDTLVTSFDFGDAMITWEGRSCNEMFQYGRGRGAAIHGTGGTVVIDRNGYEVYSLSNKRLFVLHKPEKDETTGTGGGGPMTDLHMQNWIDTIRGEDTLHSPIEEGNVCVRMLLLSNIAWTVGRVLNLDRENAHILDDAGAQAQWGREYEPGWEPKF
jgi:predicted dehydrogenase